MAQQHRQLVSVGDLFFQFTTPGDALNGNYLGSKSLVWPDGKAGCTHFIDTGEGVYKFTGSFNLDSGLSMVDTGAYTEITFMGEQPTRRGMNPVKIFKVETERTKPISPEHQAPLPLQDARSYQQPGGMVPPSRQVNPGVYVNAPSPNVPNPTLPDRPPLEILPTGEAVYGFTRDGDPLDFQGQIISVVD